MGVHYRRTAPRRQSDVENVTYHPSFQWVSLVEVGVLSPTLDGRQRRREVRGSRDLRWAGDVR